MGNIPNTNTPNLVLQSVGNGSNDSRWGTSSGGSGTVPNGTATGQMIYWNNTTSAWVLTSGPGSTAGQILQWNGTAWVLTSFPVSITSATNAQILIYNGTNWVNKTVSSDVTITNAGVATVAKINGTALGTLTSAVNGNALIWNTPLNSWVAADPTFGGYTVNMSTLAPATDNGSIPYFSNVGAVNQFIPGPVPGFTGDYYSWNTSPSGHWEILRANPGGALSNQGWSSTSIIPASGVIPITTPGKMVEVTGITGFSSYLIGFNITAKNNDTTTGRNLNASIYQSGSSVAQSQQFMVANQIGSTSVSYLAAGLTSSTTYSFAGYAYVGGATTGTANFATITVLGIA